MAASVRHLHLHPRPRHHRLGRHGGRADARRFSIAFEGAEDADWAGGEETKGDCGLGGVGNSAG